MTDPFMPNWNESMFPWHAVDMDGKGHFWAQIIAPIQGKWVAIIPPWPTPIDPRSEESRWFGLAGLDWRNSLRHRPEESA